MESRDSHGNTPLILAAYAGHARVLQYLISQGACIDAINRYGHTALTTALLNSRANVVSILVNCGADAEESLRFLLSHEHIEAAGRLSADISALVSSRRGFLVLADTAGIARYKSQTGYVGGIYTKEPDCDRFICIAQCPRFASRLYIQLEPRAEYLRFYLAHLHVPGLIDLEVVLFTVHDDIVEEQMPSVQTEPPLTAADFQLRMPRALEIDPINRCNLKCTMCHVSHMDVPQLRMLDEHALSHLGGIRNCYVQVGGSYEPTLSKQFLPMIRMLSQNGCEISLITNATTLNERSIDELARVNMYSVTISIDSAIRQTYEQIRRGARFDRVVGNVRRLRQAFSEKDTVFLFNMVLLRSNINELRNMVDFAEDIGIDGLGFMNMVVRFDDEALAGESLDPIMDTAFAKLDEVAEYVITKKMRIVLSAPYFSHTPLRSKYPCNIRDGAVISENATSRPYVNKYTAYQLGHHPRMNRNCVSPFTFAKINNDGDVAICRDFIIGNIQKASLDDVWFGKIAQHAREQIVRNPLICDTCEHYMYCLAPGSADIYDPSNVGGAADQTAVAKRLSRMKAEQEERNDAPALDAGRLIAAVRAGNLRQMAKVLAENADPSARDANGSTALLHASLSGSDEMVALLVGRGSDVNAENKFGDRPLTAALLRGNTRVADILVAKGADVDFALDYAAIHNLDSVAAYSIHCGAKVDFCGRLGWTPLMRAVMNNNEHMTEFLLSRRANANARDDGGLTPLIHAVICGHQYLVTALLAAGAEIDAIDNNGSTALVHALLHHHEEVAGVLLQHGANVNVRNASGDCPLMIALSRSSRKLADKLVANGADVQSALRHAAERHTPSLASHLIEYGARVDSEDEKGWTPLLYSVRTDNKDMARFLLSRGANVNARDRDGLSPLAHAAICKHQDMVRLLLAFGAEVGSKDTNGSTALTHACLQGHEEIAQLLSSVTAAHPDNQRVAQW